MVANKVKMAPQSFLAVRATEARLVVDDVTSAEALCRVHSLVARHAHLRVCHLI